MNPEEYEQKKAREKSWYGQARTERPGLARQLLASPLVFNKERIEFAYVHPKHQMARLIGERLACKAERMLIAPCGVGDDFPYLTNLADEVHGIDLSEKAVAKCPETMNAKVGDMLESGYPDDNFDCVASPLVFHHLVDLGFDRFLSEFYRVLKPGGLLVILEPSLWYPLNLITRPVKRLFNNPYGEVEDERPFPPKMLTQALVRTGFTQIETRAATFSHPAIFIPVQRVIDELTGPLLSVKLFTHLAWLVLYAARKPLAGSL
jgi:SAM-dependent methyltransferase